MKFLCLFKKEMSWGKIIKKHVIYPNFISGNKTRGTMSLVSIQLDSSVGP